MSEPEYDARDRVCAVCGRVLDYSSGQGWLHLADYGAVEPPCDCVACASMVFLADRGDHVPVPVLPGEVHVQGKCDFCYAPNPAFEVPARDFVTGGRDVVLPNGSVNTSASAGNWAACATCAGLIERNQWSALLRHVVDSYNRRRGHAMPPEGAANLARLYRLLRRNITGAVRPLRWPGQRPG